MMHLPCPDREPAASRRPLERYKLPCALAIFLVLLALAPGLNAQSLELTSAQRQWLAAHKVVRVAPDPDLAPIDGVDAEGRQRGLSADYLKLIAARTGLEFKVVRTGSRAEALRALAERRADLMSAAGAAADIRSARCSASARRASPRLATRTTLNSSPVRAAISLR